MTHNDTILVVDDDPALRTTLADILRLKGFTPAVAGNGCDAIIAVTNTPVCVALVDLTLPDMSGIDVLELIKMESPLTEAIILTGNASLDTAIEAVKKGAFSYLTKPYHVDDVLRDIRHGIDRHRAQTEIRRLSEALKQTLQPVVMADTKLCFEYVNPAFTRLFGYSPEDVAGRPLKLIAEPDGSLLAPDQTAAIAAEKGIFFGEVVRRAKDGTSVPVLLNVAPIRDNRGRIINYVGTMTDLSEIRRMEDSLRENLEKLARSNAELQALNRKLEETQSQLIQSEKMASIGLLAAGVAHEINNPIGYVASNLTTLRGYVNDFLRLIDAYEKAQAAHPAQVFSEVDDLKTAVDIAFERADVLALLSESAEGIERVTKIVQDLKDFSRVGVEENWHEEDIHKGLESTLNVVWNQLKYVCEVKKEYGDLPPVQCLLSQLNQVFMNLLINAAQAIETEGVITIRTGTVDGAVWVDISDTGKGIPPAHLDHIFEPFFTTKPVGTGTGLGLSVSYSIVRKHQGRIEVVSEVGRGSTFRVWLPIRQEPAVVSSSGWMTSGDSLVSR